MEYLKSPQVLIDQTLVIPMLKVHIPLPVSKRHKAQDIKEEPGKDESRAQGKGRGEEVAQQACTGMQGQVAEGEEHLSGSGKEEAGSESDQEDLTDMPPLMAEIEKKKIEDLAIVQASAAQKKQSVPNTEPQQVSRKSEALPTVDSTQNDDTTKENI